MNVIETQAKSYHIELFSNRGMVLPIEIINERLSEKLLIFKRENDKIDFLKYLITYTEKDIIEHELNCREGDCGYSEARKLGIFLMHQEIDILNQSITFETASDDKFSNEEIVKMHEKLNEIIDNINKQSLGQEILFEEIESLKNYFNLGKKTWIQLAIGKMVSVTSDKLIEETVAKSFIDDILRTFNGLKQLSN